MAHHKDPTAFKEKIRDRMLKLEERELAAAVEHYQRFLDEAVMDDREGHDNSDIAESRENADLASAFDSPVHTHQARLAAIKELDFAPVDTVKPGAVVMFGNRHFVVAVPTTRFACEGVDYMGISEQSPIYQVIAGLSKGDSFTHNGKDYSVDDVF